MVSPWFHRLSKEQCDSAEAEKEKTIARESPKWVGEEGTPSAKEEGTAATKLGNPKDKIGKKTEVANKKTSTPRDKEQVKSQTKSQPEPIKPPEITSIEVTHGT